MSVQAPCRVSLRERPRRPTMSGDTTLIIGMAPFRMEFMDSKLLTLEGLVALRSVMLEMMQVVCLL